MNHFENTQINPLQIACHEAAHAVMRRVCFLPATALTLHDKGGYCAGTGRTIQADDSLLVTLAGYSWEIMEGIFPEFGRINLSTAVRHLRRTSPDNDFVFAWDLIDRSPLLQIDHSKMEGRSGSVGFEELKTSVDDSIRRWVAKSILILTPHLDVIAGIGGVLVDKRNLSAIQVAAMTRGVKKGKRF